MIIDKGHKVPCPSMSSHVHGATHINVYNLQYSSFLHITLSILLDPVLWRTSLPSSQVLVSAPLCCSVPFVDICCMVRGLCANQIIVDALNAPARSKVSLDHPEHYLSSVTDSLPSRGPVCPWYAAFHVDVRRQEQWQWQVRI